MLRFKVEYYVEVDEEEIVANCTKDMDNDDIDAVINDTIASFDDCDYYPLLSHISEIREAVKELL